MADDERSDAETEALDRMTAAETRMAGGEARAAVSEARATVGEDRMTAADVRALSGEERISATEEKIVAEAYSRAAALIEVREAVNAQTVTIDGILVALGKVTEALKVRPTKRETWGIVGKAVAATFVLVVAVLAVVVVLLVFGARERQILLECTTPSTPGDVHECYENNQARTSEAIGQIVQANVIIAQCRVDGATDIAVCVSERLETPG